MALPNLKRLRGSRTLESLSEQTGISVSQLSRYERGGDDGRDPKLAHLKVLAATLRTSIDELISDADHGADSAPPNGGGAARPLRKIELRGSTRILVEVDQLREAALEAFRLGKLSEKKQAALLGALIEFLAGRPGASVVLPLTEIGRTPPASAVQEPGDQ